VHESTLAELFIANDQFAELEQALDVFCPFEAIGMVNQEIRHGHFLSYIFDPNRPHGFGTDCLRALMAAASRTEEEISTKLSPLDVHLMDFEGATVRREWRKIDILIEVPNQNLIVAIELKIDAGEHGGQLKRYRDQIAAEWPDRTHILLFLTKRGDDPSLEDGQGWLPVDLQALAQELSLVAKRHVGDPAANAMLNAYLAMLGRHHLDDERIETLASNLWTKHREALEFLCDRRPNAVGELFRRLVDGRDELANAIWAQCDEEVIVDYWRRSAIFFAVPAWDKIGGFKSADGFTPSNRLILLEIAKAGSDYLRCYFLLGRGDNTMRHRLFSQLRDAGADVGKKQEPTKEWNRLASMRISLHNLEEDGDLDAATGRVFSQIREFAAKHVPIYTKALSQ
jgi:hypothetical protein